jgi:chitinase
MSMRQVIGTLIYMQDKDIARSFANEKKRMGKMIGYIDKQLHVTPRQYFTDATGQKSQRTAIPWKEQGLEAKWDKYMDGVFDAAKDKATKFMTKYLAAMKKEWDSQAKRDEYKQDPKEKDAAVKAQKEELEKRHKNILALIEKSEKEWDKVKGWPKPANWL